MVMNVGLMRDKIKILRKTVKKDEYGSEVETYTKLYEPYAYIKYLNGNKRISASEVFYNQTLNITIYYKNLNTTDMVEFNGSKYRIIDIIPSTDLIFISMVCERIND